MLEKTHERVAPAQIIVNPDDQAAQATQAIQAVQAAQHIQGPCTTGLEIVTINNVGAIREEIEIELLSCEGASFTGSLTMQEAKHGIYRDCLGFKDFKNFDGVRFAFKGVRIVSFKLKEAIDVDKLIKMQHFEYKRRAKVNNKLIWPSLI